MSERARDEFEAEFSQILSQVTDDQMIKDDDAAAADPNAGDKKAEGTAEVAKVNQGDSKVAGATALTLVAEPGVCGDCLVPKSIFEALVNQALAQAGIEPQALSVRYPSEVA